MSTPTITPEVVKNIYTKILISRIGADGKYQTTYEVRGDGPTKLNAFIARVEEHMSIPGATVDLQSDENALVTFSDGSQAFIAVILNAETQCKTCGSRENVNQPWCPDCGKRVKVTQMGTSALDALRAKIAANAKKAAK